MESRFELTPFLDRIASEHVAPAGGSAAAAVGAIGAALAEMTTIHTLQRGQTAFGGSSPDLNGTVRKRLVAVPLATVGDLQAHIEAPEGIDRHFVRKKTNRSRT